MNKPYISDELQNSIIRDFTSNGAVEKYQANELGRMVIRLNSANGNALYLVAIGCVSFEGSLAWTAANLKIARELLDNQLTTRVEDQNTGFRLVCSEVVLCQSEGEDADLIPVSGQSQVQD